MGEFGIAICEHGIPVRVNEDGSMLTVCIVCRDRIAEQEGRDMIEVRLTDHEPPADKPWVLVGADVPEWPSREGHAGRTPTARWTGTRTGTPR